MLKLSKKSISLIIIGTVLLYPVIFPEARAQQTIVQRATAGVYSGASTEQLNSRKTAIESMADIDAKVKTDAINYIERAIAFVESYESIGSKANELSQLISIAPKRVKELQAELTQTFTKKDKAQSPSQQKGAPDLEQQVRQSGAEFAAAQTGLKEWHDRLATEKNDIRQIPEKIINFTARQKEIQLHLEGIVGVAETNVLDHARMLFLKAEQAKLTAEINYNEQRQQSHSLLIELFDAEQNLAQKMVNALEQKLKGLQAGIQHMRQEAAVQTRLDAQDAALNVPLLSKNLQNQFDINIKLSAELETITAKETKLAEKSSQYKSELKTLEEEFETARKRVDLDVLNEVIGLALRTQRRHLPDADQYDLDSKYFRTEMSDISERQIELDRLMREFSKPETLVNHLVDSMRLMSDNERKSLELKIQELITKRLDIIQKSRSVYDRSIKLIQDIEFTRNQLINTAGDFGELLDRHLIWIRSSKPVNINSFKELLHSLGWFLSPDLLAQLVKDITQSLKTSPLTWAIGFLVFFVMLFSRRRALTKMRTYAVRIDQQINDTFFVTIKALSMTMLLTVCWPFLFGFTAYQLLQVSSLDLFSKGVAHGLFFASLSFLFLYFLYNINHPEGLAKAHFQYPETVLKTLRRNLLWAIPLITVSRFFIGAMEAIPEYKKTDVLSIASLMVWSIAFTVFFARILGFKKGITSLLIEQKNQSLIWRFRYGWYPFVFVPLLISVLAASGYHYSALEIHGLVTTTIGCAITIFVFSSLVLRALKLARRSVVLKKAAEIKELEEKTASANGESLRPDDGSQSAVLDTVVNMDTIDEHNRALQKLVVFIVSLVCFWAIWKDVFPAFGILQNIQFWGSTVIVDGIEKVVPITLADIIIAGIVVTTTIIAVRNLPGLLEVVLLNRLPLDPGARYAYSTVSRYIISGLGFFIALNTIGVNWANLQWLIAALSVGLGFGLQEIVANFISGLIVLFERPFRVGDTVTVSEVSGTVKRIRIRATTIEDWDRKELIVPNKDFITGTLLNWSLSDQVVRIKIPVGIAYGSDTDLAENLMLKAAKNNPLVLKSPEARAVFLGFGNNSLNFEVRVFVKTMDDYIPMLHQMNRTIDHAFRKNHITIAFPQQDVHLDTTGPLDIRLVSAEASLPVKGE
jgi:potassium efflux system protein